MFTNAFVGFKKDNQLFGWKHEYYGRYNSLGLKLLHLFESSTKKQLHDIFEKIHFVDADNINEPVKGNYQNTIRYFIKQTQDSFSFQLDNDFLWNGIHCDFGYVFNLDTLTLEVYRGHFTYPQHKKQDLNKQFQTQLNGEKKYTHHVLTIHKDKAEIKNVAHFFEQYELLKGQMKNYHLESELFIPTNKAI